MPRHAGIVRTSRGSRIQLRRVELCFFRCCSGFRICYSQFTDVDGVGAFFQDNEVFYERRDYHCCSETYGPRQKVREHRAPHSTQATGCIYIYIYMYIHI